MQLFTVQLGIAIPDLNFQSQDSVVEFPIPGSRRDSHSMVKTTKIAMWVTVFGSLFLNYKCVRLCYGFSADVLYYRTQLVQIWCRPYDGKSTSDLLKSL